MGIGEYSFLLISFFIIVLFTLFIIGPIDYFGNKLGFIDYPNSRKQHFKPRSRIGGMALVFALLPITLVILLGKLSPINNELILLIAWSSFLIYLVGLFEDIFKLSPILRLMMQTTISIFAWSNGLRLPNEVFVSNFINPEFVYFLNLLFTCTLLVAITNAINWLDGLDGLASGISCIFFVHIGLVCFFSGFNYLGISSFFLASTTFGFLLKNSYPSIILMGDGGSYFLGYSLAAVSITLINFTQIYDYSFSLGQFFKYFSPILIFLLPSLDMFFVILSRIFSGDSPFLPDRRHFHYRLLDSGFSYENTIKLIYFLSFFSVFLCSLLYDFRINLIITNTITLGILYLIVKIFNSKKRVI